MRSEELDKIKALSITRLRPRIEALVSERPLSLYVDGKLVTGEEVDGKMMYRWTRTDDETKG